MTVYLKLLCHKNPEVVSVFFYKHQHSVVLSGFSV